MSKSSIYLSSCLLLCLAGVASAQEPDEAQMQNWMAFMTPGESHQLLGTRAGKWNLTVKVLMAPGQPMTESKATSTAEMIMGGRYLTETVKGEFNQMPFEGRSTVAYDNGIKKFVSTWFDNMGTGMMIGEGSFDPAKKQFNYVVKFTDPMTGKPAEGKSHERQVDADTWIMESYKLDPAGKEYRDMEITYKRAK